MAESINLTPSPEILEVIAEVDLQVHHCLAELIDNCLDELKAAAAADETLEPRIDISLPTSGKVDQGLVRAGWRQRSGHERRSSWKRRSSAGSSGKQMHGSLGMFGMGFNIATARLGGLTEVRTGRDRRRRVGHRDDRPATDDRA